MSSAEVYIHSQTVTAVYSDRLRSFLESLGELHIERATDVEFDSTSGDWVAIYRATGQEIGRGKNREDVLSQEVKFLHKELQCHTP